MRCLLAYSSPKRFAESQTRHHAFRGAALLLALLALGLSPRLVHAEYEVVISEFMAQNATSLTDENGLYSDWIELHNRTDQPINLQGWRLTDDLLNLEKWTFPNIEIEANGYLLVFASGTNTFTPGLPPHTNFSLSASGEYLGLVGPGDPVVIHNYVPSFPQQFEDVSYGLPDQTNPTAQDYLPYPTPGAANYTSVNSPLVISEVMSDNGRTLADQDGDFSDWIEIHNASTTETVSLEGWSLTDDPKDKALWKFPDVSIAPGEYLLVFASKKNRADPTSELHTNFSLSAAGEYVGLCMPDGNSIAHEFAPAFPALPPDVAFGLVGQAQTPQYLVVPTPRAANDPTPPIAGAQFQASQGSYLPEVRLKWNPVPGANHYRVLRADSLGASLTPLTEWLATVQSWSDTTAEPGQPYWYCLQTSGTLSVYPTNAYSDVVTGWRPGPESLRTYRITTTGCTISTYNSPDLTTTSPFPSDITISIRRVAKAPASTVFDANGIGRDAQKNLYAQVYRLPSLAVNGDVEIFYTDLGIDNLIVDGKVETLTANRCWVAHMEADFYETIRMTATENSTPVDDSLPRYAVTDIVGTRAPKNKVRYVTVSLAGVSLDTLDLPHQPVSAVRVSSRKGINPATKEAFLSYGGATGGRLRVKTLGSLTTRGSALEMSRLEVLQGAAPSTIRTRGLVFQTGLPGQRTPSVWNGNIVGAISVSAPSLGVSATGGNIRTSDLLVTGSLRTLTARHIKVRTGSTVELVGGQVGRPLPSVQETAGAIARAQCLFLAGNSTEAPRKDILSVLGTRGVSGVFVAGGLYSASAPNRVVPNCEGTINKIATGKPDLYGTPRIQGESWSNSRRAIRFVGDKGSDGTPEGFVVYNETDLSQEP